MKHLLNDIQSHLPRGTLVFPSEIAAEFWRRASLTDDRPAIREDAFVSWDTFKESAFEFRADALPVNRTLRTVFAEGFVRENAAEPVLLELIPPAFAGEASGFVSSIVSVLPRIPSALTVMRNRATGRLGRIRRDLEELQETYSSFMDSYGLFEPRWLQASRHFRGGAFVLVAPELADDFPEFRAAVEQLPVYNPSPDATAQLHIYPDARVEMRAAFRQIAELLDAGTDPEQIYLSVGGLDSLAERIEHEAEKADIPVVVRTGRPLSDSAPGRFIRAIGDVVDAGFGVHAVERLLLNAAIPWKDRYSPSALVIRGVENGALGGLPGMDRRWERVLRRGAEEAGGEKKLLKSLERLLPAVSRADSFGLLRRRFNELLGTLVEREQWAPRDERVLERCQEELRGLVDIEQSVGLTVEHPYRFWLDRLTESQYVSQPSTVGVAVLPYRVGAATCPEHHFVINATHRETRAIIRSFPFLGDAERGQLEEELSDRDLSRQFLDVYTASGRQVTISASRTTFEGSALPAGHFVSSNRTIDVPADPDSPEFPSPLLASGIREYLLGMRDSAADFTREPIRDESIREMVTENLNSRNPSAALQLSPTHVDRFRNCPFDYLLVHGLGVRELTLTIDPEDPARLGSLYHDIFAALFEELAADGRRFEADALDEIRERLTAHADRHFAKGGGMIPDIVYDARRELFERIADAALASDASLIDGHEPLLSEEWQRKPDSSGDLVLVGRVDRVTRAPDGSVFLVDYKRSRLPAVRELNAGSADAAGPMSADQAKQLGSLQIPIYVRLLELAGMAVGGAGYYSFELGKYLCVFDERGDLPGNRSMTRARLDEILKVADTIVAAIAERIHAGDFTCGDGCIGCDLVSVCRSRFHVG